MPKVVCGKLNSRFYFWDSGRFVKYLDGKGKLAVTETKKIHKILYIFFAKEDPWKNQQRGKIILNFPLVDNEETNIVTDQASTRINLQFGLACFTVLSSWHTRSNIYNGSRESLTRSAYSSDHWQAVPVISAGLMCHFTASLVHVYYGIMSGKWKLIDPDWHGFSRRFINKISKP